MSKRVLVSGYYGFENLGDDLILSVILQYLKSFQVIPIVLSEEPKKTQALFDVNCVHRTDLPGIWKAMRDADAFLSGGGGLFQDVTGPASPIYYGGLIEMARLRHLPVAFFAQGVGPLNTSLGRFLTKRALYHAGLIAVRDIKSQSLVKNLTGIRAELIGDPVWLWQPALSHFSDKPKRLAVSLRSWPDLTNDRIASLAKLIADIPNISESGINLIDCQAGADILPLGKLEQYLREYNVPCYWFNGFQAANGIAQSSALLGMRFHAVLVAAQLGVPTISISYDPKVQLLGAQLQLVDWPVSQLHTYTLEQLKIDLRQADSSVIDDFRKAALQGFGLLKTWLQS